MVGGDEADFSKAEPVIKAYARGGHSDRPVRLGPAHQDGQPDLHRRTDPRPRRGACISRKRAGLDVEKVIDTISKGAAQSWQMDNRWSTMVEGKFDFGFAVNLVRKDFALVLRRGARNGAELPVTALVDQFYAEIQAMGGSRWDTSSLIARLERKRR